MRNQLGIEKLLEYSFEEDGLGKNSLYYSNLPAKEVEAKIKIKADCVLSGLPYFFETFRYLGKDISNAEEIIKEYEGKSLKSGTIINLNSDFKTLLTGERIALNLLQHASSISTLTNKFVEKAKPFGIKILDTRKTTPGLRNIEKYAVNRGGGYNHRFSQSDTWMIKDNHKNFFGGLKEAIDFFKSQNAFYTPMVVEIHSLDELNQAIEFGVQHVMLDNFEPDMIKEAIKIKPNKMTYEVSGGITLETLDNYLIEGVDAISVGSITYNAPRVDISLKYCE
jgi:nicotinate-nucleotide pyrophosphorylase (carboxylating)